MGPTFFAKLGERVAGGRLDPGGGRWGRRSGRLDLDKFPRHEAKLKLLYEF